MYNSTCVDVFQEQPIDEEAVAPLGQPVLLNCSVDEHYLIERWQIKRLSREFNTNAPSNVELLDQLGIIVTPISEKVSTLTISGTEDNSDMEIFCEAAEEEDLLQTKMSCIVHTLFFGKSSPSIHAET